MIDQSIFDNLSAGQSFEEVCQILGYPNSLISSETAQLEPGITINPLKTEMYEWIADNGDSIRILFKQDALNDKVYLPSQDSPVVKGE